MARASDQGPPNPAKGEMNAADARRIAYAQHAERRTRAGERIVEHLERVAALVPEEARTVAYLHDVLEQSSR